MKNGLRVKLNEEIPQYYMRENSDYHEIVSNYIRYYNFRAWTCKYILRVKYY